MGPTFHEKMADIIYSNFPSRIYEITSKEIERKNLISSRCPLSIPLVNSGRWRMFSNQRKSDIKLVALQK